MTRKLALLTSLAASFAWGCGSEPSPSAGVDPGTGGAAGSPSSAVGGQAGAGACSAIADDAPDADGTDDNCDGADGTVDKDVYVSVAAGADTNLGTPDAPLRTLAAGIALARSRGGHVLVAQGEYAVDSVSEEGDWSLVGGYPASFTGTRKRELTVLMASSPAGISIEKAKSVLLQSLTVRGVDATATKDDQQPSAQALRLDVTEAVLSDVSVIAGSAADGAAGKAGDPGDEGVDGKAVATPVSCDGALAAAFAFGSSPGQANSQGGPAGNCTLKLPATPGKPGIGGTAGTHASATPQLTSGVIRWSDATSGLSDAQPGFGGAGGGICDGNYFNAARGGSGGCPGKPGAGGKSGGGSVGIVVLSGKLVLQASSVHTGFAGNGGAGGPGGQGGQAGRGGKPSCVGSSCPAIPDVCTADTDPFKQGCARWGADGGPGGVGGHGGGGVGGWTVGVLVASGASSAADAATTFELGLPGKGGEGAGGVRAPDGQKKKTLEL